MIDSVVGLVEEHVDSGGSRSSAFYQVALIYLKNRVLRGKISH